MKIRQYLMNVIRWVAPAAAVGSVWSPAVEKAVAGEAVADNAWTTEPRKPMTFTRQNYNDTRQLYAGHSSHSSHASHASHASSSTGGYYVAPPAPIYVAPAPVYVAPAPVYVEPSFPNPVAPDTDPTVYAALNCPKEPGKEAAELIVLRVEVALQRQGLYQGALDCKMGPQVRDALLNFQRQNGLQETGKMDNITLAMLGINL